MPSQPETVNDTVLYALRNIHADQNVTVRMLDDATFDIWGQVFVNGNPVSGGGTFPIATQPEAEAGVDNTKVMTPLRVSQAIDAQVDLSVLDLYLPLSGGTLIGNLETDANINVLDGGSLTVAGSANLRDTYFYQWNGLTTGSKVNFYVDEGVFYMVGNAYDSSFEFFEFDDPVVIVKENNHLKLKSVAQSELYFMSDSDVLWGTLFGSTNGLRMNTPTGGELRFTVNDVLKLTVAAAAVTSTVDIVVPDEVYDATAWNGSLEVPTKNAVRDKIESLVLGGGSVTSVNGETGVVVLNQDEVLDGTTYKQYSQTEKTKLAGIATGATANSSDATLLNRLNHTGTQAISTVTNLQIELDARVDTTGNETIAGVKTFSSDPIIPDEAYSSAWNGVLEPPTKNALYDTIEPISTNVASAIGLIADHTSDTTDAHDATAISFSPAGTIAATTVQAAIEEVASEAGGGGLTQEQAEDIVAALFAAGTHTNVTVTYNDSTPSLSIAATGLGGPGNTATFSYNTTLTEPPTGNQLRLDSATFSAATRLWVSQTTVDGLDVSVGLARIITGHQIYFQDRDDASKWVKYTVISDGVDDGTYYDFGIAYLSGPGGIPAGQVELQGIAPGAVGVPPGGTTGQQLTKTSADDYDVEWAAAGATISDTVYGAGWDGDTTNGASKNALYDKIQNLQPLDTDLTTIAGLTATTNNFLVSVSSAWASRTPAQAKTTLALDNVTNTSDANKPVSTAQQTALDLKVDKSQTINAQTGTSYTLVLTDATKLVTLSNAGAIALTVPTNASVAFPIGTRIDLVQKGAGQVTVGGTPTVNATPTLKTRAQYSGMTLIKEATDTWYLFGDLAAT